MDKGDDVVIHAENQVLRTLDQLDALTKKLLACPQVSRHDSDEQIEGYFLADSLGELEKLMRQFLEVELPRLAAASDADEVDDALGDIGEGFRRMLYHMVEHQEFFKYLT